MDNQTIDARQRLLDAALKLFTEKGYAAASVSEIVATAGVTKPMLYYYFKNKEGIYLELMDYAFKEFSSLIVRTKLEKGHSIKRIMDLFTRMMEMQLQKLEYARLIYSMLYGPQQGAPFVDFEQFHLTLAVVISEILNDGIINNEIEQIDIESFTTILLSVLFFCMDTNIVSCAKPIGVEDLLKLTNGILEKIKI